MVFIDSLNFFCPFSKFCKVLAYRFISEEISGQGRVVDKPVDRLFRITFQFGTGGYHFNSCLLSQIERFLHRIRIGIVGEIHIDSRLL